MLPGNCAIGTLAVDSGTETTKLTGWGIGIDNWVPVLKDDTAACIFDGSLVVYLLSADGWRILPVEAGLTPIEWVVMTFGRTGANGAASDTFCCCENDRLIFYMKFWLKCILLILITFLASTEESTLSNGRGTNVTDTSFIISLLEWELLMVTVRL